METDSTASILFWVCALLVAYTYVGYPMALALLTARRRPERHDPPAQLPSVTLVIAAYNEAEVIVGKLDNSLQLDYPADRLQILVVSDCSDDGTDDIVAGYASRGVELLRLDERGGKTAGQNAGVRQARGEILVFSDANSLYRTDAVRALIPPFGDPEVGCVCGQLRYTNPRRAGAGEGEGFYWRYEQYLKRRESLLASLVGANGSIYAVRRELFEELEAAIISDFIMPIRVYERGRRVVYAPDAVAVEETASGFGVERKRRRRIVARSIYSLWRERAVLNPFRYPLFAFQVVSHKVVRWLVPVFLLAMLVSSAWLAWRQVAPFPVLAGVQVLFYGLAVLGGLFPRWLGRSGLFYVPAYFCAINLGALTGLVDAVTGQRHAVWQPVARPGRS